ncbi:WD domain-containing protein [Halenospora varia]|nr:WD domain-containing protein [Halenospora varia]
MQDIVEGEPEEDYYTCVWTKDLESGDPLLCVAGNNANIKVIDVLRGKLLRVLPGHGGEIDDLAISPINPYILASASEDSTVRIWSLDPAHAQQPCAAILEGDGHKETVMSIAFHSSGRYLLSGGVDHIINLWTLPEFPDSNTGTNKPTRIYYPHFSTSEIHLDIVDCVCFHGDLILSKAANEECIVLWSINGFSSSNPSPPPSLAPTTHDAQRETRSAFTPVPSSTSQEQPGPQYTRLLQFSTPESPIIFMRFSLYPGSTSLKTNPILAFCNTQSKIYFWDLARLNKYQDFTNSGISIKDSNLRPSFLNPFQHRNRSAGNPLSRVQRDNSPTESSSSFATGNSDGTGAGEKEKGDKGRIDWERSVKGWQDKYEMGDSIEVLEPHKEEMVKGLGFTGRQLAWSADGMWCVVVGSAGVFAVLQRWGK